MECISIYTQQAVEKALKALSIEKKGKFKKTHDLKLLAKEVKLPIKYIPFCEEITLAYIYTRYPIEIKVKEMSKKAKKFIKNSEVILKWVEKKL